MPQRSPCQSQPQRSGDECLATRDGTHRAQRSVQSRTSDMDVYQHARSRQDVLAWTMTAFDISTAPPVVLIMGPTGAGKTDLVLRLAEDWPIDIISVDSAMVYRDMNIGTGKPPPEVLARHPHRLVDILDPSQAYSAGQFVRDATAAIEEAHRGGRLPVLVGGTMLYFRALRRGLAALPSADPAVRAQIDREAAEKGWPALHRELAQIDPQAAARIRPNDAQ